MGVCVLPEDTLTFWKGIADVGLLGEVVTNISSELLEMLNGVQQRQETTSLQDTGTPPPPPAASVTSVERLTWGACPVEVAVLSNLAQVFGLLDSVKKIVERRKQQTDPSQEQMLSTLTSE